LNSFLVLAAAIMSTPVATHSVDAGEPLQETVAVLGAVAPRVERLASTLSLNQAEEPVAVRPLEVPVVSSVTHAEMFPDAPERDSEGEPLRALLVAPVLNAVATDVVIPPENDIAVKTAGQELVQAT